MEFVILTDEQKEAYREDIFQLLKRSDREFVPPFSQRQSTTQGNLKELAENPADGSVRQYHEQLMRQEILAAVEEDRLLGLVSFLVNTETDRIRENPNLYISTLVLHPEARGKNLTCQMYEDLFFRRYKDHSIFTRTWSTNMAHIKILSKFHFAEMDRIPNDRGEGIDTVYFSLLRDRETGVGV